MSWTSAYAAVEVGGATLHGMVTETALRLGDRPALVDGRSGSAVTYTTLASRMEGVAAGLAARGFAPGHVLALWAPNLPQWAGVALGAMAAGGTVTGANPACTERELAQQLTDSGASMLVTIPSLVPTALAAATSASMREVIVLGEADGATPISAVLPADASTRDVALDPDAAVALMPYSSGTTGLPKGVMLTHANLVTTVRQLRRVLRVSERDTLMAVVPFFHVMGFVVHVATALATGATVVTMPSFDLEQFLELIQHHRATFLVTPPPLMAALAHHPLVDAYDLSSVEFIISGGAPLSAGVQRAVAA